MPRDIRYELCDGKNLPLHYKQQLEIQDNWNLLCRGGITYGMGMIRLGLWDSISPTLSHILLAINRTGKIIGFIFGWDYRRDKPLSLRSQGWYIEMACALQDHVGVGREMIQAYIDLAKTDGIKYIYLYAIPSAVSGWVKKGFEFTERYGDGSASMVLNLNNVRYTGMDKLIGNCQTYFS
jgi:hypothetical protein